MSVRRFKLRSRAVAKKSPIRFAVIGLGHIAQAAIIPAFKNAENCRLAAFVTNDAEKARKLAAIYNVKHIVEYDAYEAFLSAGEVDAVYIALPNNLHCDFAVHAAQAGVHVLCEKPMAVTEDECKRMITAAERARVKLMVAYRLHYEEANLSAIKIVESGRIGEPRIFEAIFTLPVEEGNIRVRPEMGGGTLYDIGIYCINAARYLFRDEPVEVVAASFNGGDARFQGVDEATSGILRFSGDRVATFTSSFGVTNAESYRVLGTRGELRVEPCYRYVGELKHYLTIDGKTTERVFAAKDQFAPLLVELARCIREDREPEANGLEGMADVRIIESLYKSAIERRPIQVAAVAKTERPDLHQAIFRPPVKKPKLVKVESATGD
jgi:glucose-fructose oxidoreductase